MLLDKWVVKTYVIWPKNSIGDVYLTLRSHTDKIATPLLIFEQQISQKIHNFLNYNFFAQKSSIGDIEFILKSCPGTI